MPEWLVWMDRSPACVRRGMRKRKADSSLGARPCEYPAWAGSGSHLYEVVREVPPVLSV